MKSKIVFPPSDWFLEANMKWENVLVSHTVWFYCTDRLSWVLLVSTPNTENGTVLLCSLILREASVQKLESYCV